MKILGQIENRTENWKTARTFAPYDGSSASRLAAHLAKSSVSEVGNAHLELFWYGMRDFMASQNGKSDTDWEEEIVRIYCSHFSKLREWIMGFDKFRREKLCEKSYNKRETNEIYKNLKNTEIDIVVETDGHLFIGEAKYKESPNSSTKYVLVHQLIRQYVMATVLKELCNSGKDIVPFVVGVSSNHSQVEFMIERDWLKKENVLRWDDIQTVKG